MLRWSFVPQVLRVGPCASVPALRDSRDEIGAAGPVGVARDASTGLCGADTMRAMPDAEPLKPSQVEIRAVQFVGTNVEMTVLVDAPAAEAERRLVALLSSRLGLFAQTRTGEVDGRARFSVLASPLDRLFHKIGPSATLTLIKHASVTMDLSDVNVARQGEGLMRSYGDPDTPPLWTAWDAGKLLGTFLRRPDLLDLAAESGPARVAGVEVLPREFPHAILPNLDAHVAEQGGVEVDLPTTICDALRQGR